MVEEVQETTVDLDPIRHAHLMDQGQQGTIAVLVVLPLKVALIMEQGVHPLTVRQEPLPLIGVLQEVLKAVHIVIQIATRMLIRVLPPQQTQQFMTIMYLLLLQSITHLAQAQFMTQLQVALDMTRQLQEPFMTIILILQYMMWLEQLPCMTQMYCQQYMI